MELSDIQDLKTGKLYQLDLKIAGSTVGFFDENGTIGNSGMSVETGAIVIFITFICSMKNTWCQILFRDQVVWVLGKVVFFQRAEEIDGA